MTTSTWSESLQQQTRDAIEHRFTGPDGKLHFKHIEDGFAFARMEDLIQYRLLLVDKESGKEICFKDAGALIAGGWAID